MLLEPPVFVSVAAAGVSVSGCSRSRRQEKRLENGILGKEAALAERGV